MTPPSYDGLTVSVSGGRGDLALSRPDQLNPLSTSTLLDIASAARWFDAQVDVRVVVVRGEGRAFSAGADLSAFDGSSAFTPQQAGEAGRHMADAIEAMKAVAIAQIHGHCVGGGLVLAAACDLRIAAEGTRFAIPEVDLGIPLAWGGIPRLVREIGPALTKELVMTCRPFDADEALRAGFLNAVTSEAELRTAVDGYAELIASKPAYAVRATKQATNAVTAQMVGTAGAWSDAAALASGLADAEGRESARAYIERLTAD